MMSFRFSEIDRPPQTHTHTHKLFLKPLKSSNDLTVPFLPSVRMGLWVDWLALLEVCSYLTYYCIL